MNNYTDTYACRNIFNTIKMSEHSSLEKYTSYFIESVVCEMELENEQNCNILTPTQIFWLSQPFFPVLLGCPTGSLGTQPLLGHGSHPSIFSPIDLNFLSPGLYDNLTSTYFLRALQFALNSRSPPDIFDRMHLLFTQVHFFFWQLGWGQYATQSDELFFARCARPAKFLVRLKQRTFLALLLFLFGNFQRMKWLWWLFTAKVSKQCYSKIQLCRSH